MRQRQVLWPSLCPRLPQGPSPQQQGGRRNVLFYFGLFVLQNLSTVIQFNKMATQPTLYPCTSKGLYLFHLFQQQKVIYQEDG